MTLLIVDSLRSNSKQKDPSVFPSINYKANELTFMAYLAPEIDVNKISSYSKITVFPIHLKDSSVFENMDKLRSKKNFVLMVISANFLSVLLHVSSVSNVIRFNGNIEVVFKNTVVDDNAGDYLATFPSKTGVLLHPFTEKMNFVFGCIMRDYIEFLKHCQNGEAEPKFKLVRERVQIAHFPKQLIQLTSIVNPSTTQPVSSLPPVTDKTKSKDSKDCIVM